MTPERWQQVKQIFNSAIKYRPEERGPFLSEACSGDHHLRDEVQSLINSHEKDGSFIDAPAYEVMADLFVNENSDLQVGQTIGSYRIVSFINRGGMGEVYLAEDLRLRRRVALKSLPVTYTSDADRLRRFEQEARSASALNHPNIITIFEILQTNGIHLIATEFVEGETLRQRLSYSKLTLAESLQIAIQVADALAAAHKAGIIHRDIKPENIMLRPDGYVKVLDFGLAKLSEQTTANAAEAPTRQVRTGAGVVMGTAGYMSPEQARGKEVDERSDIFSLGAVIYEMVAHRKPFEGETPSDILAAILKTDPIPLARLTPHAPPELVRIVTKALRKDREERYQVIRELLLDLKALKQELEFQVKLGQGADNGRGLTAQQSYDATHSQAPVHVNTGSGISKITESISTELKRHKLGTAVFLCVLMVLAAGIGYGVYRYVKRAQALSHFWDIKLSRVTNSGNAIDAIVSPDGKYIVYALSERSSQSLWVRQVSAPNDKQIVPPAQVGFFGLTFSRDSTEVFYAVKANMDSGVLYRIPILGGTPVKVLEHIDGPISFSPDGKRFVFVRGNFPQIGDSALVTADADGSDQKTLNVRKLPERFAPLFFTGPSWSKDGALIAVSVATAGGAGHVLVVGAEDGKEQEVPNSRWPFTARVEWLPDTSGLLVIAGDGPGTSQVWMLSYPDGKRRRITNDLSSYRALALTTDGNQFSTVEVNGLVNVWIAPDGDATRAIKLSTGNVGFYASSGNTVTWSRDGKLIVVSNESGSADIWQMDSDGSNRKQLTSNRGSNVSPVASPDGRYIVFASTRDLAKSLWRMNIDGSNQFRLTDGNADAFPAITPDNQWVIYAKLGGAKPTLWKVPLQGGTAVQISDTVATTPTISPDGKLIAYLFPESADPFAPPNRIGVFQLEDGKMRNTFKIPSSGTVAPIVQFSRDGKSIVFSQNANNVSNIWSQALDGSPSKQITDFKDSLITGFAWSGDGKQLACTRGILLRDAVIITDAK